jgi:glycosyltransferase involved in cell wall biosynthesis
VEIHQFATSLTYGDAISNEMLEIQRMLREKGFRSEIFIRFYDPRMAGQIHDYREYSRFSSTENIVIFHFSIGSPVSKLFFRIPDRKIMIYHNITPHSFFLDYHRILTRECYKGRLEIDLFTEKVDLALGDSEYNRRELEKAGYKKTGVLPLVLDFTEFDGPGDPVISRIYSDKKWTLLFVGRVIPNKKFEDVIKVFYFYKKFFNPESRLILAGDYRGMERYLAALQGLVTELALTDVIFTGHVTFPELVSYYDLADIYVSMSEHEGFGVPLLEAFHKRIPVVAATAGAVEETMNGGGILFRKKIFLQIAAVLDRLQRDKGFYEQVAGAQVAALEKYSPENVGRILFEFIERLHQE